MPNRLIALHCLLLLTITACSSGGSKNDVVRTDAAPIQKRITKINEIQKIYWRGGSMNDEESGPTVPAPDPDMHYHGFIWLSAKEASRLREILGAKQTTTRTTVAEHPEDSKLWSGGSVGVIDLLSSEQLSAYLMPKNAHGKVGFVSDCDVLYFDLIGQ